ncbi:hypothetical protein B2M27_10800 [Kluyvera intermedia]|uniref:Transposase IS200-like domain-containing protein n=1 Tax=Kluyvera intermedia TaxID=61648 RepID=A0ABX3UGF3_KLUIN|nr:hypothetical protein B2M27_10800 [Kluyvera intermedia]
MERHLVTYRRYYVNGGTWFFTVNLKNRRSFLLTTHIEALRQAVNTVRQRKPFHIDAWVVLPEHIHCVWTLPADDTDYSGRWRDIKKQFTRTLQQRSIWQPRFWEHTIRDDVDYRHHVDYVYNNPVKHGWVEQVRDWPFSTFHRDVRRGLYPEDWGGGTTEIAADERR